MSDAPPNGDTASATNGAQIPPAADPAGEFKAATDNLREAAAHLQMMVGARVNQATLTAKKLVVLAVLGVIAGISGLTMLITCAVILVLGLARALSSPLPLYLNWVGYVVVGLVGVAGSVLVTWLVLRKISGSGKKAAARRYEEALARQRATFGTDASRRAAVA